MVVIDHSPFFESQKRHGKHLFAVIELTNDQVEARRKGFVHDLLGR